MVELAVEDSGPGIPGDMRRLLFEKYHTSLDVVSQGNGIGLSLCKNLVHLLKGDISFDEAYNSGISGQIGARFVVRLNTPAIIEIHSNASPADGTTPADVSTKFEKGQEERGDTVPVLPPTHIDPPTSLPDILSVLLVDDDAILRKLFIRSIRRVCPNWTIQGAASGEEALRLMSLTDQHQQNGNDVEQGARQRHCSFDLVFMDQYMASTEPQLLGTEAVAAMRARGIIDCSVCGLSANDLEHEFKTAGADYFVLKPLPCEKNALIAGVIRITGRIRSRNGDEAVSDAQHTWSQIPP